MKRHLEINSLSFFDLLSGWVLVKGGSSLQALFSKFCVFRCFLYTFCVLWGVLGRFFLKKKIMNLVFIYLEKNDNGAKSQTNKQKKMNNQNMSFKHMN